MEKLLVQEPPLIILPKLAAQIGLNEAIILQANSLLEFKVKKRCGGPSMGV